jgi:hypothetical protein
MTHVKGALSQTLLQAAEARLTSKTYAAFQALAAAAIQEVRATSSLAWLSLATHLQILEALERVGTVAMVEDVNAHMMVLLADKPILRPLKEAAFRRTGASPSRLLHLAPSIWPLLVRGVGTVVYEPTGELSGVYRLLSLPPAGLVPAWTHAIAGSLRGVIEVSRCDGTITLQVDEKAKTFSVTLQWKSRM